MLTAIIIVARVQPGTSKGITDLLLPQPSSGLKSHSGPSSLMSSPELIEWCTPSDYKGTQHPSAQRQQEDAITFVASKANMSSAGRYLSMNETYVANTLDRVLQAHTFKVRPLMERN